MIGIANAHTPQRDDGARQNRLPGEETQNRDRQCASAGASGPSVQSQEHEAEHSLTQSPKGNKGEEHEEGSVHTRTRCTGCIRELRRRPRPENKSGRLLRLTDGELELLVDGKSDRGTGMERSLLPVGRKLTRTGLDHGTGDLLRLGDERAVQLRGTWHAKVMIFQVAAGWWITNPTSRSRHRQGEAS